MAEKWIKGAIKHPGALTATAKRMGFRTEGGLPLGKLGAAAEKSGDTTLKRRVNLAKTLRKMHK